MKFQNVDFKISILVLTGCFFVGAIISYFTSLHWLPAGLIAIAVLLVNGIIISIEDRQPNGWDHVSNENPASETAYKKMLKIQIFSALIVVLLAIVSYAYTSH